MSHTRDVASKLNLTRAPSWGGDGSLASQADLLNSTKRPLNLDIKKIVESKKEKDVSVGSEYASLKK